MERGFQMDINQSSLSKFKTNKSVTPRSTSDIKSPTESTKLKETSSVSTTSLKQLDLKEGQTIRGEIIDHRYNEVRIQIEPGKQVITAKLTGEVPLSIGQEAQFQVTEDTADRLVLKYIPNETTAASDVTIQKALTASNLPMTDRNRAIVEELLNHRMPIDKQTLQTLIKLSHTNREASPLTLVLMYKNNIPLTSLNIKQFEAYQNGANQLLNDIHKITKTLVELLRQPASELTNIMTDLRTPQSDVTLNQPIPSSTLPNTTKQSTNAVQLNNKLIDILYNISDKTAIADTSSLPISNYLGETELTQLSTILEQRITDSSSSTTGIPSDIFQKLVKGTLSMEAAVKMITTLYFENSEHLSPSAIMETIVQGKSDNSIPTIVQTLLEQFSLTQDNPAYLASLLPSEERFALLDFMKDFPDMGNIKSHITDGTVSVQDTLTYINENLKGTENVVANRLIQSPEYLKLLEDAFHQKWTITPENLAKKTSVSDLYQNLQEDLEKLSALDKTDKITAESLRIHEPVKNMQENLHFMKDLNEIFTYLQLPVQFKERDVHSDLYVFKRKKAPQGNEENLSVLLHLDMTNLGPLNIHIQMNHNLIQAKFYLDDKASVQLINKNLPSLQEALREKGYNLHAELVTSYVKPDFSKDFIEQSSQDNYIQRYTFDIRT
ncbi:MAG: hypothetical protein K0S01_859 [Herbinix sp.]|jgi:hypothetical protein|nr:hypothetical protein [Herbinix sp.]